MEGSASCCGDVRCHLSSRQTNSNSDALDSYGRISPPSTPLCQKHVRFSRAHVFYFTRQQGSSSVPERGGCSLGMAQTHLYSETYGALQYRRIRRMERKLKLAPGNSSLQSSLKGRQRGIASYVQNSNGGNSGNAVRVPVLCSPPQLSPQSYESPIFDTCYPDDAFKSDLTSAPPPRLSPPKESLSATTTGFTAFSEYVGHIDTDSETSLESSTVPSNFSTKSTKISRKLLPLHPTVRSRLLKRSGVANIDESERWACASLRSSRALVGCGCITSPCDPDTCSCAFDGVPCQVDRPGFPCSCDPVLCCNPSGRVEFSKERVRAHASHVLQRLASECQTDEATQLLSSEHGECLWCLKNYATTPAPPPSPPLPSTTDATPPPPPSPCRQDAFPAVSIVEDDRLLSPLSVSAECMLTPPKLISDVPPTVPTMEDEPGLSNLTSTIKQANTCNPSPISTIDDVIVLDDIPDPFNKVPFLLPSPPVIFTPIASAPSDNPTVFDLDNDADMLLGKSVFPPAPDNAVVEQPTSLVTVSDGKTDTAPAATPQPDLTPFGRLSLRKRRIIRSPYPLASLRKRYAKKSLLATGGLTSVAEVVSTTPTKPPPPRALFDSPLSASPVTRQTTVAAAGCGGVDDD
uniref:CSRNP_N domain-containing protein n=1 Tax=Mesocestoides corti TaxID=53468 RepID=A0A5K3EZD4_MESCO